MISLQKLVQNSFLWISHIYFDSRFGLFRLGLRKQFVRIKYDPVDRLFTLIFELWRTQACRHFSSYCFRLSLLSNTQLSVLINLSFAFHLRTQISVFIALKIFFTEWPFKRFSSDNYFSFDLCFWLRYKPYFIAYFFGSNDCGNESTNILLRTVWKAVEDLEGIKLLVSIRLDQTAFPWF